MKYKKKTYNTKGNLMTPHRFEKSKVKDYILYVGLQLVISIILIFIIMSIGFVLVVKTS